MRILAVLSDGNLYKCPCFSSKYLATLSMPTCCATVSKSSLVAQPLLSLIFFCIILIEFSSTRFDSFIICIRCTCLMCLIIFRRNVLVGFVNRINVSVKYWHINSYSSPNSNNRVGFCSNLHKSVSAPISIGTSFLYSL